MLRRLAKATGTSLSIGTAAVMIIVALGISVGSVAGYVGGWVDNLLMRFVDIVLSLPALFIILALVSFWGGGSVWVIIIAIGITSWTLAARLVRAEFLRLREVDYVAAARALGASPLRIILRHMLPPALAPIIVAATLGVADSVVIEAALSFLGFGISQPEASLGNMLTEAQTYFFRNPWLVAWPGLVLVAIVMSASFLGDGLRDALDPGSARTSRRRHSASGACAHSRSIGSDMTAERATAQFVWLERPGDLPARQTPRSGSEPMRGVRLEGGWVNVSVDPRARDRQRRRTHRPYVIRRSDHERRMIEPRADRGRARAP